MMPAPERNFKQRWKEASGLKSFLALLVVIFIYMWASSGLGITPAKFLSANTWRNMGDLVMRLGPFHRIASCRNAEIVWGNDDPWDKPNPQKVKAVCDDGAVFFFYDRDLLDEQVAHAKSIWEPLMQTFRMAVLGTTFGALFAIPFSLLASRNLVRFQLVYYGVRTVLNVIRTIPDLLLAAVLVGVFGLGALPGVLALAIFSFALIAKLTSESIESIDPGPLEAGQAVGANRLQQIFYAVVPQVLPNYLAYTLYVLEVCVRSSTVLGIVGAGGIGQILYADLNLLRYRNVGAIIVVMLIAVMLMDYISNKLRERLI